MIAVSAVNSMALGNDTVSVMIVHINDLHGEILNFSKLKSFLDRARKENDNLIFVCTGDIYSGNPFVDQYQKKGAPMIELLNDCGLDFIVPGNHAFDYGQKVFNERRKEAEFEYLCANLATESSDVDAFNPYRILPLSDNCKIAFIGFTQRNESGIPDAHPDKINGLVFRDVQTDLQVYQKMKDSVNVVIALTHQGMESDQKIADSGTFPDIIIGGHSHEIVYYTNKNNIVFVTQAGFDLGYCGTLELEISGGEIISIKEKLIDLYVYPYKDTLLEKKIELFYKNPELTKVIGTVPREISGWENVGYFMTEAVLDIHKPDFVFQNMGGVRASKIDSGDISIRKIFEIDPFNNDLYLFHLSVEEIKDLITKGFNQGPKSYLIASGLSVNVIANKQNKIENIELIRNGHELKDTIYTVAMNSYIARTYNFDHKNFTYLDKSSAETLIEYVIRNKEIRIQNKESTNYITN